MNKRTFLLLLIGITALLSGSCKKFVDIGSPTNTVTTATVFIDSASASSAVLGIYSKMMDNTLLPLPKFASGLTTIYGGQSADEIIAYNTGDLTFYQNTLVQENGSLKLFWQDAYSLVYLSNICIEGLQQSTTINDATKSQFIGEAKFARAFTYFYLINFFGDVPYLTSSDWTKTFGHGRTPVATIYDNIIQDLLDAQAQLPVSYPTATGKTRPTQSAATALLARVYLYTGQWAKAEQAANSVISSNTFSLTTFDKVFLANNSEAIWQLAPVITNYNTPEGYAIAPTAIPYYYLQPTLATAFEPGDLRYTNWVKSVTYSGTTYYCPYKYKVKSGATVTEYYDVLRLAEQYLIRAEVRNNQSNTTGAISDLNVIRKRAGLTALSSTLTQDQCKAAIEQERRIELFCEWGHRWLDLKRTNRANAVLSTVKPKWVPTAVLYPIPITEIQSDPSLAPQNDGY